MDIYYHQQLMKTLVELEPMILNWIPLSYSSSNHWTKSELSYQHHFVQAKILELEQRRTYMKDDDEALAKALELQNTEFEIFVIHSFKSAIGIMDKLDVDTEPSRRYWDQIKRHLQKTSWTLMSLIPFRRHCGVFSAVVVS
ncbi:hypothetical protein O9929_16925 [Vibrio lentus]|nr:hypothetical protein [Vibrio lentus]